jgi:hypothetical protein
MNIGNGVPPSPKYIGPQWAFPVAEQTTSFEVTLFWLSLLLVLNEMVLVLVAVSSSTSTAKR